MATLKRLINGQDITFDTHQAGDCQPVNWRAVHMEKQIHGKKGKIKFPLVGDDKPDVSGGMSQKDYESVTREVSNELRKNRRLVNLLAEIVVGTLERFSHGVATTEDAKKAAKQFAEYFSLDESFVEYSERYAKERLVSATSTHISKETGHIHKISQSAEQVSILRIKNYVFP